MKKFLCVCLSLSLAFGMSACGSAKNDMKAAADELLGEIKEYNLESFRAIDDGFEEPLSETDALTGYMKECASKITYEITDVNTSNSTVTVQCHYIDSYDMIKSYYSSVLQFSFDNVYSYVSDEEVDETYIKLLDEAISNVGEDVYKDSTATITFVKNDNGYAVSGVSEEMYDVATAGVYSAVNSFFNLFGGLGSSEETTE